MSDELVPAEVPADEERESGRITLPQRFRSVHIGKQDYDWRHDFDDPARITPADVERMLTLLSPRQVTYAHARMWGQGSNRAATRIHADRETVYRWEDSPWWHPLLERERAKAFGDKAATFMPLMPLVMQRFEEELRGQHGEEVAHDTAKYVADHLFGKPTVQVVQKNENEVNVGERLVELIMGAHQANLAFAERQRAEVVSVEVKELPAVPASVGSGGHAEPGETPEGG